jgi:hypothetical protein
VPEAERASQWILDGNNVMGAGADGWWNDPEKASARLASTVALWCRTHDDDVVLVFDGPRAASITDQAGGNLTVDFARRTGRDAADDRIVELVDELFVEPDLTVVTSDKGLAARLPPGVNVMGAGGFRSLLGV